MDPEQRTCTIKAAMGAGDLAFCKALLPKGGCLLDYADGCSSPEMVEWKLACGYLQRDDHDAAVAIRHLAATGRVDLMQRILDEHSELPEHWLDALQNACKAGKLAAFKWLVELPVGRLLWSAGKGHDAVHLRAESNRQANALVKAVEADQMESVTWLLEHFPASEKIPDYCVLDEAARRGRVKMLELFQSLGTSAVPGFFPTSADEGGEQSERVQVVVSRTGLHRKVRNNEPEYRFNWKPTDPMDDAAANGELETVQWLHENRADGCTTAAMNEAAANRYLTVVKWLNAHRLEGCTAEAMDFAASNGHLEIVQWLHENMTMGCTSAAMDLTADGGRLETLKWLKLNRQEGCTVKAIQNALSSGHLSVACWLLDEFPEKTPLKVETLFFTSKKFDVLLFLHTRFPELITFGFVRDIHSLLIGRHTKRYDIEVLDWLTAHYPLPDMPQGQDGQFEGFAGQFLANIRQRIARQLGGGVPPGIPEIEPQRLEL